MKKTQSLLWIVLLAFAVCGANGCSDDAGEASGSQVVPIGPEEPQGLTCGNNQVICDGVCVHLEDDVDHCGACGNKCADSLGDSATDWLCRKNTCVAQACKAHYHLQDGACIEDDAAHCAGMDCTSLPGWDSGYCDTTGLCVAEACLDGYHLNTDETPFCEEYVQDCDGDASVCDLREGATEMACVEGKCAISKCDTDHYHWNEEQTLCVENSIHECGATFVDCTNYGGWNPEDENNRCDLNEDGVVSCIAASCLPDYHVYSGPNAPCEPDDHENCGEHEHACAESQVCLDGVCTIECADGLQNCSGACVDLASSLQHCGSCGAACTADVFEGAGELACENSVCKVKSCKGGYHLFDGKCEKDTESDCGSHGTVCASHLKCVNGKCGCSSGTDCGSGCVNTANDKNNCGACGNVCKSYLVCSNSKCGCSSGTDCGSSCVDLKSDNSNCGSCGTQCVSGKKCSNGNCVCNSGTACGSACVDLKSDNNNCGACGNKCTGGTSCNNGSCKCPSGQSFCNGSCVALNTNSNCGACGNACGSGKKCSNGSCVCNSGSACGSACVDLKSDNNNCGACGNKCTGGTSCNNGSCKCPSGQSFCSGKCINVYGSDSNNCGGCNVKCGSNQTCTNGVCKNNCPTATTGSDCQSCASGYTRCGYRDGYPLCLKLGLLSSAYCDEYCNKTGKTGIYNGQYGYYNAAMCNPGQTCYINSYTDKDVKCK
ncbi:MAG: hypothetical protein J6A01_01670 [Proteobacteria bacterium]|nr:hypothetical protein [Pseudomonadota bacterium]